MKTCYLGILAILLLTGCAGPVHQLDKKDSAPFIAGELIHGRGKDNRLVLEVPNRRYEARGFAVERQTNLAELRKRYYGVNPKHWSRIFSGLDTDHVTYSVETIAISAEGDKVACHLVWGGSAKPAGVCTDQAGAEFPVRFE
ncbi:MAG: hypothetical protein OEV35_00095 [Gallionellaceae bacterium]|nr:hypothetical protein [Gallionellaceae bacterium]